MSLAEPLAAVTVCDGGIDVGIGDEITPLLGIVTVYWIEERTIDVQRIPMIITDTIIILVQNAKGLLNFVFPTLAIKV
jgi:hypothetical protein